MNIIDKLMLRSFRMEDWWRENKDWAWFFIGAGAFFGVFALGVLLSYLEGHQFLGWFFGTMALVMPALMAYQGQLVRRIHARRDKVR